MKKYIIFIISIFFICISTTLAEEVKLVKCIDGDTFKANLKGKEATIRMLAIDTPEIAKDDKPADYFGKEASEYTCKKLTNAKKIVLEYDKKSDRVDKYDRVLAWIFVDDKLLEEELVKQGYAKVAYLYDDYKYTSIIQTAQEIASNKELGIWNTEEKNKFDKGIVSPKDTNEESENKEIIIVTIIFLLLALITKLIRKK